MKDRTPDALMVAETQKMGWRMSDRVAAIADYAEPLLGVDRASGQRAYIRIQGNGKLFITTSIHDTINFATGHARVGQPRYRWQVQPDGTEFGYLRRWKKKRKDSTAHTTDDAQPTTDQ